MLRPGSVAAVVWLALWSSACGPPEAAPVAEEVSTAAQALSAPTGILVGPPIALPGSPEAVASDGSDFFAAWACGNAICGARVRGTSGLVDAYTWVTTVGAPAHVRLAFDGAEFLVVWAETRQRTDVYAARVRPDGTSLDGSGFVVSQQVDPVPGYPYSRSSRADPFVGFDGTSFDVTWYETNPYMVFRCRVSTAGQVLDPAGVLAYTARWSSIHAQATAVEGAWAVQSICTDLNHCFGTEVTQLPDAGWRLDANAVLTHLDLSLGGSPLVVFDLMTRGFPITIADGTGQVSVPDGQLGVFAYRLGQPLPGALVRMGSTSTVDACNGLSATCGAKPLAAYDGASHLVVWSEATGMVGQRLSPAGALVDAAALPIAAGAAATLTSTGRGVSLVTAGSSAYLLVTRYALALADVLGRAGAIVSALPGPALRFPSATARAVLQLELANARSLAAAGAYASAASALSTVIGQTDGCATARQPDRSDLVVTCGGQRELYATATWGRFLAQQAR